MKATEQARARGEAPKLPPPKPTRQGAIDARKRVRAQARARDGQNTSNRR